MIGTAIRGTLFFVEWTHLVLEPPADGAPPTVPPAMARGEQYVVSADPSGSDLYEVARAAVLNGKARAEHQFAVVHSKRICEVRGRAIAPGGAN